MSHSETNDFDDHGVNEHSVFLRGKTRIKSAKNLPKRTESENQKKKSNRIFFCPRYFSKTEN